MGHLPAGVSVGSPPWPDYTVPQNIQKAVKKLHDSAKPNKQERKKLNMNNTNNAKKRVGENKDTKPAPITYMFVLLSQAGGPYRDTEVNVVGVYSTKQLAIDGAKKKFEESSDGFYKDGSFDENKCLKYLESFDDHTADVEDSGTMLRQQDQEGCWEEIFLQKTQLDEKNETKKLCRRLSAS